MLKISTLSRNRIFWPIVSLLLLFLFNLLFTPNFFRIEIKQGHLYVLQTPLFRVRDKKETFYCYSEREKQEAIYKLKGKPEITRFKGLGEISPDEFKYFIREDIRLDPVLIGSDTAISDLLSFYMGKNTPERQKFIIDRLRIEKDYAEDIKAKAEAEEEDLEEEEIQKKAS